MKSLNYRLKVKGVSVNQLIQAPIWNKVIQLEKLIKEKSLLFFITRKSNAEELTF